MTAFRILLAAATLPLPGAAAAQAMNGMTMPEPHRHPAPTPTPAPADHAMPMPMPAKAHDTMRMPAAFGPYPMTREASGTSWQPDLTPMAGVMRMTGRWTLMGHAMLSGVYDRQSGPRGDDKAFASGMVMAMATGALTSRDTVQFRAMMAPDPLFGRRGYPLLLATGETADGRTPLVDRQHPHDLFMELSASYSRAIGERGSAFVYAALPGEPAFGPPAFMHRQAILDSPEAPISHHWLDSTHITFGVLTAGVTWDGIKLEASRFTGREPDQHRYGIERPRLDSTAARIGWNPSPALALQASWARQRSPEQLEPEEDQERWSASALYARHVGAAGWFAATLAWGRKTDIEDGARGHPLDAYIAEASFAPDDRWTVFARAERVENDELLPAPGALHGPAFTVGKASVGAIRDLRLSPEVKVGVGGLVARSFTPAALDRSYGGDRTSGMAFVRLKVGMRARR